jgi:hypothetical protein
MRSIPSLRNLRRLQKKLTTVANNPKLLASVNAALATRTYTVPVPDAADVPCEFTARAVGMAA